MLRPLILLPLTKEIHERIKWIPSVQKLGHKVQVGHQGGLQDDGDVRGVEQLDRVRSGTASLALVFDWQIDTESLEVDHDHKHQNGSHQVGDVGQILSVESFFQGTHFVGTGNQEVNQRNQCSFEFTAPSRVDCSR